MTFRIVSAGFFAALALLAVAILLGNQHPAFADEGVPPVPVNPCEDIFPHIPFPQMGCDSNGDDDDNGGGIENPPVDPCEDIFPHIPNMPDCGGDDDGGGGSDDAACADGEDNDGDSLIDSADPGCVDANDTDETDPSGGGGSNPACSDTNDNDGDGKVDMDDPGCSDANDSDETDPSSGGGGGGGGGGSGGGGGGGGSVLGTTTPALSCDKYISTFIRSGQQNDSEQVKRVQNILKNFEGMDVEETGEYDAKSVAAINAFQLKYASEVLTPWDIQQPTGYVFLTTRKKLNEVYCKNMMAFPLTEEEQQHVELVKKASVAKPKVPVASTAAERPQAAQASKAATTTATTAAEKTAPVKGNRISDFFRRLFDRLR